MKRLLLITACLALCSMVCEASPPAQTNEMKYTAPVVEQVKVKEATITGTPYTLTAYELIAIPEVVALPAPSEGATEYPAPASTASTSGIVATKHSPQKVPPKRQGNSNTLAILTDADRLNYRLRL